MRPFIRDFRDSISFSGLDRHASMTESEKAKGMGMEANVAQRASVEHSARMAGQQSGMLPPQPVASGKQVGAAIPVSPTCSMSIIADGEVTQDGLEKLILYIELIKGSFPKTSLEALHREATEKKD
jgi:hypothetical protein